MEYLNPENPDDLKIILDDQIDIMLEQYSTSELFHLLSENQRLKEINKINGKNHLLFILNPEFELDEESCGYLLSFWQQIYFDYFNQQD